MILEGSLAIPQASSDTPASKRRQLSLTPFAAFFLLSVFSSRDDPVHLHLTSTLVAHICSVLLNNVLYDQLPFQDEAFVHVVCVFLRLPRSGRGQDANVVCVGVFPGWCATWPQDRVCKSHEKRVALFVVS